MLDTCVGCGKKKKKEAYGFGFFCHLDSYRFHLSYFHMCSLLADWAVWESRLLTFLGVRFLRCPHCSVKRFRQANFVHQHLKQTTVTQPWVVPKQAEENSVYEHERALGWCCGIRWNHFFSDVYSRKIISASSLMPLMQKKTGANSFCKWQMLAPRHRERE